MRDKKKGNFKVMPIAIDENEHSLEMHLPFIRKVFKDRKDLKLLPILVGSLTKDKQNYYGRALAKYLGDSDENLFVISSDFCHWGDRFEYIYLTDKITGPEHYISKQIERLDKQGIQWIIAHDADKFAEYMESTDNTICG